MLFADDLAEGQEHRTWKIPISWISEFGGLVDAREFIFWSAAKSFFSQMTGSEQAKAKEEAAAIMRAKQLAGTSPFPFLYLSLFVSLAVCQPSAVAALLCRPGVKLQHVGGADVSRSRAKEGGRGQIIQMPPATTFDCGVQRRWRHAAEGGEAWFGVSRGYGTCVVG